MAWIPQSVSVRNVVKSVIAYSPKSNQCRHGNFALFCCFGEGTVAAAQDLAVTSCEVWLKQTADHAFDLKPRVGKRHPILAKGLPTDTHALHQYPCVATIIPSPDY